MREGERERERGTKTGRHSIFLKDTTLGFLTAGRAVWLGSRSKVKDKDTINKIMHQFYQSHQIPLARRATEPVPLAPTASMIDPNLESHRIQQQSQINAAYGRPPVPNHHIITNGFHLNNQSHPSTERELPSRDIDDTSIDDAYVQFIMYCNPSIPANVDTSELKKGFRTPPKSDGKTFSPYTLFGLISRLETKDIKTWTQLVIDLGVEPPDAAKNQSSQKVQQYAVRLKVHSLSSIIMALPSYCQRLYISPLCVLIPVPTAMAACFSRRCFLQLPA